MIALEPAERNRVLLAVRYAAGLRASEACRLRWRNLQARGQSGGQIPDPQQGRVHARRFAAGWRMGPVRPPEGAQAGLDAPVFASRSGKPLEHSRVLRVVKEASQRAIAANVSTHWLRHAHASHALDHGAPIHLVQATLGAFWVGGHYQPVSANGADRSRVKRPIPRFLICPTPSPVATPSDHALDSRSGGKVAGPTASEITESYRLTEQR